MKWRVSGASVRPLMVAGLVLVATVVLSLMILSTAKAGKLTAGQLQDFAEGNILYYNPAACMDGELGLTAGSLAGTGDFAKVMSAKNADKSFFNGSGDVPSAQWSDGDTSSMKRLLETYGDLAYQLGEAVGAPYVAILVQMRYEDPNSVCGRNNFWGNGCDPSHAYAGGATVQGQNLGEGFAQYGKTLTNGFHNQALGVADAKEYLVKIGPTWVGGNPNGPGYGSIEGMKKSVDALQAYIDSAEGQAIVKEFGNYHGGSGGGRGSECRCGGSSSSSAKWEDGWLKDDSISGIKREDVNGKSDLSEKTNAVGSYITKGGKPNKILLHSTEGTTNGYEAYPAGNKYPAHFTIDLKKKEGYQHFSIYQPALAIKDVDQAGPIQIEIVGMSSGDSDYALSKFTDEEWNYLATVLKAISEETGIPLTSSVEWGSSAKRMNMDEFTNYEGILGHMHAPRNDHQDPGDIWQYVKAAIDRGGGYDQACASGGGNGDVNKTAIELAWAEYGQHGWNDPSPAYAKALKEVGMSTYGDACAAAGGSCDAFVATVMRYSGVDKDFACCGVSSGNMLNYLTTSGKYQEVSNGLGNLKPGDIRIGANHIELYVEVNGEPHIAAASYCERSGDIGNYYDNDFRVFRYKK